MDGIEKPIDECGIFRCVQLPLNTNQVIFKYQPTLPIYRIIHFYVTRPDDFYAEETTI